MKKILIIGAGRSATALIDYVLNESEKYNWNVIVADADFKLVKKKVHNHKNGKAVHLDVMNVTERQKLIRKSDLVASMLPATLHMEVAKDCIEFHKHLITPSYISKLMYNLDEEVRNKNLIFMGELGLDPGIDHMSAMQKIDEIKEQGGKLIAFRSYTGGLVAPESDDNPWHYKLSWNPRNVVLAGQGTAQFLENGKFKYIPYNRLFKTYRLKEIQGMGEYEVYPNRDSLLYREVYGLNGIPNLVRGTIRHRGFCDAWGALVQIGLTNATYPIVDSGRLTYHEFLEAYIPKSCTGPNLKVRVAKLLKIEPDSLVISQLEWLGLFSTKKIRIKNASPAQILEQLLIEKWKLKPTDKDLILMQHEFEYLLNNERHCLISTLVMEGNNSVDTAMSRLVGLPLGIFVKLVMIGKIKKTGVNIPIMKSVYEPVLKELEKYGVVFKEKDEILE